MLNEKKSDAPDAGEADVRPQAERRDVTEWASQKAIPVWLLVGAIRHADWPLETTPDGLVMLVTEAEFDAACAAVRSIPVK